MQHKRDADLCAMRACSPPTLLFDRGRTVHTLDLGAALPTTMVILGMPIIATT